jgi:aspartate racemase
MITRLGIIGGVGPLAAAHFYRRLIQRTPVAEDAAHLPVVLASEQIPSRIAHLCGTGPSPVPALVRAARILVDAGADAIVIPSATTHAYRDDVVAAVDVPVLDLYDEVDRRLADGGWRRPVLLATSPTAALRLYEAKFSAGVRPLYPSPAAQREIDALIGGVKSGAPLGPLTARLGDLLAAAPWPPGADCVVLACTELPVIAPPAGTPLGYGPAGVPLVDVTDVLADAVLRRWVSGSASCAA